MMQHKLNFTTDELVVIREAINSITIKGSDSIVVGNTLSKVIGEINKAIVNEREKIDPKA